MSVYLGGLQKDPSRYLEVGEATAIFVSNQLCGRAWSDAVCRALHLVRFDERMVSCPID